MTYMFRIALQELMVNVWGYFGGLDNRRNYQYLVGVLVAICPYYPLYNYMTICRTNFVELLEP